jgi:hypothetical protein
MWGFSFLGITLFVLNFAQVDNTIKKVFRGSCALLQDPTANSCDADAGYAEVAADVA